MSHKTEIVTGDDVALPVSLTRNGVPVIIPGTATIQAALISKNKKDTIIPATSVLEATIGSSWATGIIVVTFDSTVTAAITKFGTMLLEIQVNDNGKKTWFVNLPVVKGTIA